MALVWITSALAGLGFYGSPATTTAGDAIKVAFRPTGHPRDPRLVWPPAARHGLPWPVGMYAVVVVEMVGRETAVWVAAPTIGTARASVHHGRAGKTSSRQTGPTPRPGTADRRRTAARTHNARPSRQRPARRRREPVGHHLRTDPERKDLRSRPPAILEWKGSLVATSVKSDLLAPTLQRREEFGETWVFDRLDRDQFTADAEGFRLQVDPRDLQKTSPSASSW